MSLCEVARRCTASEAQETAECKRLRRHAWQPGPAMPLVAAKYGLPAGRWPLKHVGKSGFRSFTPTLRKTKESRAASDLISLPGFASRLRRRDHTQSHHPCPTAVGTADRLADRLRQAGRRLHGFRAGRPER